VGAGPGGAILALLLARKGVPVTLLEAHKDFDRDFRGDTVHPSTLELLDEIGLADRLLELRHTKVYGPTIRAANGPFMPVDLRNFKTKFPYIMLVPQTNFLEFIVAEAKKISEFPADYERQRAVAHRGKWHGKWRALSWPRWLARSTRNSYRRRRRPFFPHPASDGHPAGGDFAAHGRALVSLAADA
jgi:2-polyprenyl-6-methoxyphenol hydroxylase-like FAD-dependent oxidoreductase